MTEEERKTRDQLRADYHQIRHKLLKFMEYLGDKYGNDKWDYWGSSNLEDEHKDLIFKKKHPLETHTIYKDKN